MSSLFSELLLPCNCRAVTEMHQKGCCCNKRCNVGSALSSNCAVVSGQEGTVRPDQTSATTKVSVWTVATVSCYLGPEMKGKCVQRSRRSGALSSALLRNADIYKALLAGLSLAYLATMLSSPRNSHLLFAKFWLSLQLGPQKESMWMQFLSSKRG